MLFKRSNRTIHVYNKQYAVGQGGLHLSNIKYHDIPRERTLHFAYIYDCGAIESNQALLREQIDNLVEDIKKQFYRLDNLYIFISHLHEDHVNGLVHLKNALIDREVISERTDKRLFLPYTSNMEKNIIIAQYKVNGGSNYNGYRMLIDNPQDYFDNFYDVYYVDDGNDNDKINISDYMPSEGCINNPYIIPKPYKDKSNIYSHHQEFKIGNDDYWVLRMFYRRINRELVAAIRANARINFNQISDEAIEHISNLYRNELGRNSINTSSLCLYSGPCSHITNSGFMHTGDIDLKETFSEFRYHYKNYLHNVVVAQIPHHGSKKNSNLRTFDMFNNLRLLYVTKQREPNGRQQPKLYSEYVQKSFIKQVTEKENTSLFFENYYALDTLLIKSPTVKEQRRNEYNAYTGILKFEYIGNRRTAKQLYKLNDSDYITRAPQQPLQLTNDKELFMVFVDKYNKRKPYIVGRAKTYGFNKNNIDEDVEDYKYYVRLYDIDVINGKIENGIPLYELMEKYGLSMFPGTKAKKPYYAYSQKSYRIISDAVKDEINRRLDEMDLVRLDP